ncbi:hypothetical protein D4R87_02420 [bacterium]|nr:MAG: hypothetical protein D4R87_02420 [bacterium]
MKKIKFSLIIFLFVVMTATVFIFTSSSDAFDGPKTHNDLARMSGWVYNNKNQDEKLSDKQLGWIQKGAVEEDNPATRCLNHFYDPITNKPIIPGADTALEWAHNSTKQTIPAMGGDFTWEQAKYAYLDGDEEKAFESLGHILHLVEDMAVPAHVRGDDHMFLGDPFEKWVMDNGKDVFNNNISNCSNLDDCMKDIANFTNANFFSTDSIDSSKINSLKLEKTSKQLGDFKYNYLVYNVNQQEYLLARVEYDILSTDYYLDSNVYSDYWQILGPEAVSHGARVIEIFFEEVEEARLTKKPKSIWSGFTGFFKDVATVVYKGKEAVENTVSSFVDSTTGFVQNSLGSKYKDLLSHGPGNREVLDELLPVEIVEKDDIQEGDDFVFNGEIVGKSTDVSMNSNEVAELWVRIKNTGVDSWDRDQVSLNITTKKINGERADSPFFHRSWVTRLRPTANSVAVNDGDIITLGFKINAPANSGIYNLRLTPVYQDADEFYKLGNNSASWSVNVQKQDVVVVENKVSQSISLASLIQQGVNPWTSALKVINNLISNVDKVVNDDVSTNKVVTNQLPFSPTVTFSAPPPVVVEPELEPDLSVYGCTDITAENYNADATCNEGCEYSDPVVYTVLDVVINEIAWMGTNAVDVDGQYDEWIELYNNTDNEINLTGWTLIDGAGQLELIFSEADDTIIEAGTYYLIEEDDDNTVNDIDADFISAFKYRLKNSGEKLLLLDPDENIIDEVDCLDGWFKGDNDTKQTMERIDSTVLGNISTNWESNDTIHINGKDADGFDILGTPQAINSTTYPVESVPDVPDVPDEPDFISNTPIKVAEYGRYRGYLQTVIYDSKLYYAWTESFWKFDYCLAFGKSNIPDAKEESFSYKQLYCDGWAKKHLQLLIVNDVVYFSWIEKVGNVSPNTDIFDLFIAKADLTILDSGVEINDDNFEVINVTEDGKQKSYSIDMKFVNEKVRVAWSGEDKDGNKGIRILDIDPQNFDGTSNIRTFTPTGLNGHSGGEREVHSVVDLDNNKQYFTWYFNKGMDAPQNILQWAEVEIGDEDETWKDWSSIDDNIYANNPKITILGGEPTIYWKGSGGIQYTEIDKFSPQYSFVEGKYKHIEDIQIFNEEIYMIFEHSDITDYQSWTLSKISEEGVQNDFTYSVSTVPIDEDEIEIVSSTISFYNSLPVVSWVEYDRNIPQRDLYNMIIEY